MSRNSPQLAVVVIGFGRMGQRHAEVYSASPDFSLAAICGREKQRAEISSSYPDVAFHTGLKEAIASHSPDLICISTHIDSHDPLTRLALENNCHVFLEKPVTTNVVDSRRLLEDAQSAKRQLIIGHILHHDQLWSNFIIACRQLRGPVEIKIHLDQHSTGEEWDIHQRILQNSSIASDCAIHFFDIMSQAIPAEPKMVDARTACTHNIASINDNFLSAKVEYSDGSTGTYRSGWGPGFKTAAITEILAIGARESISIEETEGQAKIIRKDASGDAQVIYSELNHLENATRTQQEFVYNSIKDGRDLQPHHDRTLGCMTIAAAVDQSIARSARVRLESR